MFGVISEWLNPAIILNPASVRVVISIWITGFVIKLMDDYLDQDYDAEMGYYSLARKLDKSILPYAILAFAIACYFMPQIAISYFIAAYAVGMSEEMDRLFPSRLNGYQETLIVLIAGFLGIGFHQFAVSLLVILAIQAVDDIIDYHDEKERSNRNWAVRWGKHPVQIFAIISVLLAFWLEPLQTTAAMVGSWLVTHMMIRLAEPQASVQTE